MKLHKLLLSATLALAGTSAAQASDCQLRLVNTIPLTMSDDGRAALVPVTINGSNEWLLLDTGGAATQITAPAISRLKLPVSDSGIRMLDLSGHAAAGTVYVDTLTLGRLQDHKAQLLASPFDMDPKIAGVLAADYMARYDVEFDFANAKMNYLAQDHCPGKVVYWPTSAIAEVPMKFIDHHLRIDVQVNGEHFRAIIDTGAYGTTMSAAEAKRVFGLTEQSPDITNLRGADGEKRFEKTFDSLAIEGIAIGHPHITIIPDLIGKHDPNNDRVTGSLVQRVDDRDPAEPTMLIGMNILTKLRFVVAFSENKIYVTPATPPPVAAPK